ncbi:MAG: hypothetical protein MJZ02_05400 [Paludibacteraceae bacterium]|nr:hypothetical protein [Paludibacteraceae bacterium]
MELKNLKVTEMSQNEQKETKGGIVGLFFVGLTIIAGAAIGTIGYGVAKASANKRNSQLNAINKEMGW